ALRLAIPVEQGDSGGGVFDQRGQLVAVVWGGRPGEAYATYGMPLRRIIERALGAAPAPPRRVVPLSQHDTHHAERSISATAPASAAWDRGQRWCSHRQKREQVAGGVDWPRDRASDAPFMSPEIPAGSPPGSFLAGASWREHIAVAGGASVPVGVGI